MIETLQLQNFKRHSATTIALHPLTILVGPNGAGKTSVLEALHMLSRLDTTSVDALLKGPLALERVARRRDDVREMLLQVAGRTAGGPEVVRLLCKREREGEPRLGDRWTGPIELQVIDDQPWGPLPLSRSLLEQDWGDYWPELHSCAMMRIDPRRVCVPSQAAASAVIASDGACLPTVLANLKLADDGSWDRLLEALQRLVPEVQRFRTRPTTVETAAGGVSGYALFFDTNSGTDLRAEDMSDGTLVLLALLAVIYSPARPRLLLLDSLETALHPTAQMRLTKVLRKLVEDDPSLQIVATTHSPFIADCVPPEAVQVFAKAADGTTGVRSLAEHPEAERFRGRLSSGQLWTLDDEEHWVFGETP
jgi:predicted ATPase